jgi:hypothetical protein
MTAPLGRSLVDGTRSVPKLGRSKSEMSSATSLAAGTSRIGRILLSRPRSVADGMARRLSLESGFACRDFPARRNEFPVPDHREFVAPTAKRLRNLGTESVRRVQFRTISLHFPCRSGKASRDEFAPDCLHRHLVCWCRDFPHASSVAREIPAIPRGFGGWALAHPNRRRRVRGLEGAAARVFLCWQIGRFGFAFDSLQRKPGLG